MASSRLSPPRRSFQPPPTLLPKASDRLTVPKYDVSDPLLGNLSPESTLQALSNTDAVPKNEKVAHDILSKSISQASPTERALGIRAAVAAQKLGQWYREVQKWEWPKRTDAHLGKGFLPPSYAEKSEYYGSLPASVVHEHEKRIEEIRDGMEGLDVEELKEHVLNAHIPGRSRPSSANSTISVPPPLSYVQLSDFTAVITATILRALPLLSRLNNLLSTWDVRLLVLRQIPGLLQSLQFARTELNSALDMLKSSEPPNERDFLYSITNYHSKRVTLESNVLLAGRRMDRILDSLDGREDSLPEHWIDDVESTEADFAAWVMQAEKRTVENEWRRLSARSQQNDKQRVEATEPDLEKLANIKDIAADAPSVPPVETQIAELEETRDTSPDIVPQTRPPPIQIGRSLPMETIVEEIGSPFEPSTRVACGVDEFCVVAAGTELPDSPSPLPVETPETRSVPGPMLAVQLDSDGKLEAVVTERVIPEEAAEHLNNCVDTETAVAEPVRLVPNVVPRDMPQITAKGAESSVSEPRAASPEGDSAPVTEPPEEHVSARQSVQLASLVEPPVLSESVEGESSAMVDIATEDDGAPVPQSTIASLALESENQEALKDAMHPSPAGVQNDETNVLQHQMAPPSDEIATLPELPEDEPSGKLTESPIHLPIENATQLLDDIIVEKGQEKLIPDDQIAQTEVTSSSMNSILVHGTECDSTVPILHNSPSGDASKLPSPLEKPPLREQRETIPQLPQDSTQPTLSKSCDLSGAKAEPSKTSQGSQPRSEVDNRPQPARTDDRNSSAAIEVAPAFTPERASTPERCVTPPNNAMASLPNLFKPIDNNSLPVEQQQQLPEKPGKEEKHTPKKPLDSPIKLSKMRPGRLDLDKHNSKPYRRPSNGSDGSLSDYPSLVSSPEIPEPRTSSSNGTPLLLETPPNFPTDYRGAPVHRHDHTLREDRLIRLDAQKPSPRDGFTHNRALSLPLQRFINERMELNYESGSSEDTTESSGSTKKAPLTRRQKSKSATTPADIKCLDHPHLATTREESTGPDSDTSSKAKKTLRRDSAPLRQQPPNEMPTARLKKRLTAHPSLESIGLYKSNGAAEGPSANKLVSGTSLRPSSRPSSPAKRLLRPKDHMDEKINSILTTLPGRIHLVAADQDDDAVSVASSLPFRGERFRSHSPQGTPTRSYTPTPSLIMRPSITRRRHSHAPEEGSVKLYHLHRGGKSAPTKLFVRTVGENGERVMVRVGGGWADLAEYLREYAIHHGRRHVSETPRVEVEGLSSRESPSYSPPGSRVPLGTGRNIPTRPRSVLSNRPASSLAVRKTRRSSNVSDMADFRTSSAGDALNVSFSPMSSAFPGRRLSVSSNISAGAMSSVSEMRHGSPSTTGASPAMPLGLAGPKPRAKHATISAESEAWVEDVLGQARRSSSLRPFKLGVQTPETESEGNTPTLPKSRSISDIGKAGSSKRVALRGLR